MPDVVQLRIHGVGKNTPDSLLGLHAGSETIRVAGDDQAGFHARPSDPHVQGYVHWKLTGSSPLQALWIFLLPFTLFNLANWMYPPEEDPGRAWARLASRFLMFLLGVSLTLAYLLWEFALVAQGVFYQWAFEGELMNSLPGWVKVILPGYLERPPNLATAMGIIAVIIVGLVVYYVARRTRQDFEGKLGPEDCRPGHCPPVAYREPPPAVLGFPIRTQDRLTDRGFWARWKQSTRLLRIHMFVGTLFLCGLAYWAFRQSNRQAIHPSPRSYHLRHWFVWLNRAQIALLLGMLVLFFLGWGWRQAKRFRWAAPVSVAVMTVAITNGFFTGVTRWAANQTNESLTVDLDQGAAFAIGSTAFVLGLVGLALYHWQGRRREMDCLRSDPNAYLNAAAPGVEQDGITTHMRKQVALRRSVAKVITNVDLVVTFGGAFFLAASIAGVYFPSGLTTTVPGLEKIDAAGLVAFGGWLMAALVGAVVPLAVIQGIRQADRRALIKVLWDAIAFWPRRFHPFAVRPYAERAIPEIQGWLYRTIAEEGRSVVVAAHSQGSVLAYCALLHLARWKREAELDPDEEVPEITRRVALVTFGCPLREMHAHFFPAYFRYPADFLSLRKSLFSEGDKCLAWKNFYHRTDYVGRSLFHDPERKRCDSDAPGSCDEELPDPPMEPRRDGLPLDRPMDSPPDLPLPAFTQLAIHSHYNEDKRLRNWVDDVVESALRPATKVPSPTPP